MTQGAPDEAARLDALAASLTATGGRVLMEHVRALILQRRSPDTDAQAAAQAAALGLTAGGELTDFGWRAGHALREYLQWEERGRRMPRIDWAPALREESFRALDVLEVGSGFGCNLLSLQPVAKSVTGVDIDPAYPALGAVLARLAGLPAPRVLVGRGEALPVPDASADAVLSFSSIQYMHIEPALAEMRRVLRPGGKAIIATLTFAGFVRTSLRRSLLHRRPRKLARDALVALATLAYPLCGRALLRPLDPAHLPRTALRARARAAGLTPSDAESRVRGDEAVLVAYRQPAS